MDQAEVTNPSGLSSITIVWGIVMTCMGLVKGYGGLLACRVLLGVAESGGSLDMLVINRPELRSPFLSIHPRPLPRVRVKLFIEEDPL